MTSGARGPPETTHRMLGACVRFLDKEARAGLLQVLEVCEVPERSRTCGLTTFRGSLGESPGGELRAVGWLTGGLCLTGQGRLLISLSHC